MQEQYVFNTGLNHKAISGIVNVFRCAAKVHPFVDGLQVRTQGKLFFQVVFNSFYVVVCSGFNCFDSSSTNSVKIFRYGGDKGSVLFIKTGYFGYLSALTKKKHPLALNFCAVLN